MASISTDKAGNKLVRFRFGGREFTKSADTTDGKIAASMKARVEDTIRRLTQGWLQLPDGADPGEFIISGGTRNGKAKVDIIGTVKSLTIEELFSKYDAEFPPGAKDASTMALERTHKRHLLRTLKASTKLDTLRQNTFQGYANARSAERWRDKPIKSPTIIKELETFRVIWNWAVKQGHVTASLPFVLGDVNFARTAEKAPFRTYQAIIRTIKRGGLTDTEKKELWESLYLDLNEVHDVLDHVRAATSGKPYVYVMFVVAAMTGARRSEICESRVDDWDLDNLTVNLREKKRKKGVSSYRVVEVNTFLADVIRPWIANHPGGQYLITRTGQSLTRNIATHEFKAALYHSDKWKNVPGFHTFRHSFASIMAMGEVHEAIIDRFMGHQTAEQRERYRHLFPKNRQKATELLARPGT